MVKQLTLLGVVLCVALCSGKVTFKRSLVVSTELPEAVTNETKPDGKDSIPVVPKIYEMRVDTNVSNRYAKTLITSKVRNLDSKAREATFSVVTPDKAFISGFTMEIDGKKYEAYVQEKEEAKQTYDKAVSSGQSAAHVAVSARDSNRFTVSVNVEPQSKAIFYLRYEELLTRKNDKYEIVLNIHPGQPVKDLEVQVNIVESRPLKFVEVPSLRSGNEIYKNDKAKLDPEADIKTINETSSVVTFKPDIIKQKLFASSLGGKEENGLNGQFVVQYDVARDPQGGEVLVDGGYFVHFFAPEDLPPLKKQVVFVLDTSGSMSGIRITQLKEAMNSILGELKPDDIFSIVEFNSVVKVWNVPKVKVAFQEGEDPYFSYGEKPTKPLENIIPPSFQADEDTIQKAKEVIQKLDAFGGTDIQSALKIGLQIVARNQDLTGHQPIIVFLTDGEPTVGEFNTNKITSTITELNVNKVPIFSLSFGDGADREFLQKISLNNQGFARHIYEAADAYLQLEDFYKQVSSPLLSNVTFKYVDNVKNVTKKHFPILFGGGELYITGIIADPGFVPPAVEGWGIHGPIRLQPKVYQAAGSLERLWAYLTVKQLLEQRDAATDKKGPTEEALRLALKYSFVTDLTSLVVVKPNATSAVDTEDAAKSDTDRNYALLSLPAVPLSGPSGVSYSLARPMLVQHQPVLTSGYSSGFGGGGYPAFPSRGYSAMPAAPMPYYGGYSGLPGPPAPMPVYATNHTRQGRTGRRGSRTRGRMRYSTVPPSNGTTDNRFEEAAKDAPLWIVPSSVASNDVDLDGSQDRIYGGQPALDAVDIRIEENAEDESPIWEVPSTVSYDRGGSQGLIVGGQPAPLFTTVPPRYPSTTQRESTSERQETELETTEASVDDIFSLLPWLNKNGTVTFETETYSLGLNETVLIQPGCSNSVNSTAGTCTLLHKCPQIHKDLIDVTTFKKHFCKLEGFGGVCCPVHTTSVKGN